MREVTGSAFQFNEQEIIEVELSSDDIIEMINRLELLDIENESFSWGYNGNSTDNQVVLIFRNTDSPYRKTDSRL
ncbi:hypothetical protein [Laceyella putida]|uniref:Uncharacterized protein n=1 Tax=Laceyella putida TaxID=110101 RepID=A0ABW2RQK6_9BACL